MIQPNTYFPPVRKNPPKAGGGMTVLFLVLAWAFVGIPAAWGVSQTVKQSLALFRSPPPVMLPSSAATLPTVQH